MATKFTFRKDAENYIEILELTATGDAILWDVRFPTQKDAESAIETYKDRLKCRASWGI